MIRNPVLPGFNPDPSILRVGADYYIATSTFEWFPGVRIHHSTDLVTWTTLGGVLTEKRLLDLTGADDSCGVWAPDLSYVDGTWYLLYTDVASFASGYWDPQNYLITAPDLAGPWSDRVVLHARGFDSSLYHEGDVTWMLSMTADWRPGRNRFAGIQIQRYDRGSRRLVGPERMIFHGTAVGVTEGPHIYRRYGWYYLVTAEGGTSWEHQITVARSRALFGPYEVDPSGPMLTSFGRPELALQKAGHGSLVSTPDGRWYLAHLVARPYSPLGPCVLGRETAIQAVEWPEGGWPRVDGGVPAETVLPPSPMDSDANSNTDAVTDHDDFDQPELGPEWSTLRRPATPDWVSLTARESHLRVHGGQSPVGRQRPSLVARRVTARVCSFETEMEFAPATYRQLAGVAAYYNTRNWHFLYVTADDDGCPALEVLTADSGRITQYPECRVDLASLGDKSTVSVASLGDKSTVSVASLGDKSTVSVASLGDKSTVSVTDVPKLRLRATFDGPDLRFAYALPGGDWQELPAKLDATILSDEHAAVIVDGEPEAWGFTGAFVGLWVQDLGADGGYADFDSATYRSGPG